MARGGPRPGSGRKPGSKNKAGIVLGMDGARRPRIELPTPTDPIAADGDLAEPDPLLDPPADLSETEQAFWRKAAPRAVRQRTLTDAEVLGFRELCQHFAMKEQIAQRIAKAGADSSSVDGLLRQYVKLGQRVDAMLARFKLTAFGKPSDGAAAKPVKANPWASLAK